MAEWTDWADGNDLAGMTRSGSPLSDAGYDVDSLRANPQQRTQAMEAMASPYVLATPPQPRGSGGAGAAVAAPTATMPQPGMAAAPPMATPPRIGQPAAAMAPPPPTANDVTSLDAAGREAIRQSLALGQAEAQRAEKIAANPAPDTNALEAKIGQESVPTPYRDAGGKPLPQYAPSTLGKIGRGLKGAALGFFEGGPFGLGVGAVDPGLVRGGTEYGAPNRAYESVDAARQTQLGQDTQSLQNLRDRWKDMVQSNKDVTAASTGANAALGNTVKGVEDLTPKSDKTSEKVPTPYMIDGKLGYASFDPQKGWINETPGANFGAPVTGDLQPYTKPSTAEGGKPVQGTLNGRPSWGLYDPQKGWVNANPGVDFGKPMAAGWAPPPNFAETGMYEPVITYDPTTQQFTPGKFDKRTGKTTTSPGPNQSFAVPPSIGKEIETAREIARESDTRLRVMRENEADALKGNQQAMISLVANHIGMTLGQQKGARINQAVWNEAVQSAPLLQRARAQFNKDGILSGVTLSPDQIKQMVGLAQQRRDLQWRQAVETAQQNGIAIAAPKEDTGATTPGGGGQQNSGGNFDWGAGFHPLPAGKQ